MGKGNILLQLHPHIQFSPLFPSPSPSRLGEGHGIPSLALPRKGHEYHGCGRHPLTAPVAHRRSCLLLRAMVGGLGEPKNLNPTLTAAPVDYEVISSCIQIWKPCGQQACPGTGQHEGRNQASSLSEDSLVQGCQMDRDYSLYPVSVFGYRKCGIRIAK